MNQFPDANIAGALILLVSGVFVLVKPRWMAMIIHGEGSARFMAELRVNFGGFWIGLAATALLINQPIGYIVLGGGWLGIVLARLASYVIDRPQQMRWYWLLLAGEIVTAALLLTGLLP